MGTFRGRPRPGFGTKGITQGKEFGSGSFGVTKWAGALGWLKGLGLGNPLWILGNNKKIKAWLGRGLGGPGGSYLTKRAWAWVSNFPLKFSLKRVPWAGGQGPRVKGARGQGPGPGGHGPGGPGGFIWVLWGLGSWVPRSGVGGLGIGPLAFNLGLLWVLVGPWVLLRAPSAVTSFPFLGSPGLGCVQLTSRKKQQTNRIYATF